MQSQALNLSSLPKEYQDLVEVDKAAAYAVWKERKGVLVKADEDIKLVDEKNHGQFVAGLLKYRAIKG